MFLDYFNLLPIDRIIVNVSSSAIPKTFEISAIN
jgi:hypothetical protein